MIDFGAVLEDNIFLLFLPIKFMKDDPNQSSHTLQMKFNFCLIHLQIS